jgi:hypothetical protein
MAKKKGKRTPGGRVTPKGTRPDDTRRAHDDDSPAATVDHRPVARTDPSHNRPGSGPQGPTRAGHHRGQR